MSIIKKIPWKALLILAIGFFMGLGLGTNYGHKISWLSFEKTLNTKTVSDAVNKPTTTNTTTNNVEVKAKKSDGLVLDFDPKTDQKAVTNVQLKDTCYSLAELKQMPMRDIRKLRKK